MISLSESEFITREEFEKALDAAVLRICRETADDRKRITQQENFSTALYDLIWVEMRPSRMKIEAKLKKLLPGSYFNSRSTTTEVTD